LILRNWEKYTVDEGNVERQLNSMEVSSRHTPVGVYPSTRALIAYPPISSL